MSLFDGFLLLSLFYIGVGITYLVRFLRHWRSLWDDDLTADDAKLAASSAFFLLIPPTVALHELGHAVAVRAYGLEVLGWVFYGYMGAVAHHPTQAGDFGNFVIALAGNLVTLAIGVGVLAFGLRRPGHPVRNILAIELGRQSLFLVLVFYPLICVVFDGDFRRIYDVQRTPIASAVALVAHVAILFFGWRWWTRSGRARARVLCSPIAARVASTEAALERDPTDANAAMWLGVVYATSEDYALARATLAPVVDRMNAQQKLVWANVLLETGEPARALDAFDEAGRALLRPEDRDAARRGRVQALGRLGRDAEAQSAARDV